MRYFRRRCCLFIPEPDLSYDEATAKYAGRMTKLKHLQSKYKPYDGIRIYSLNGSKTGYTNNFRVDLRDGTSIEAIFCSVLTPFENKGYTVWGDNAFTTVNMLRYCKDRGINFAGTTRTTYGFPSTLVDDSLEAGEWRWLMTSEGFLAAYWADVGYVKLMSNFHSPESGQVMRRVTGQADKEARGAPTLGVEYNNFMGGTDLKDFIRGMYTTHRRGKKWWRCLFYWVLDTSMYNAFVLYRWCWKHIKGEVCEVKYKEFIKHVATGLLPSDTDDSPHHLSSSVAFATPNPTPLSSSGSSSKRRPRITSRRTQSARRRLVDAGSYEGPDGEERPPLRRALCPGGDLVKTTKRSNKKGFVRLDCLYCKHAWERKKIHRTPYLCELCGAPLCVTCNYRYHRWVNGE